MSADETKTSALDETQRARAEALRVARTIIETRTGFSSSLRDDTSAADLVDLAEYVIEGLHPLDRYDADSETNDGGA